MSISPLIRYRAEQARPRQHSGLFRKGDRLERDQFVFSLAQTDPALTNSQPLKHTRVEHSRVFSLPVASHARIPFCAPRIMQR